MSYLPLETNLYYGLLLYVLLQSLFLHSFHLISCNKSARIFHCKCCIWRQSSFSFFSNAASPARWCCPELSYSLTLPRLLCYSWFAAIAFKSSNTEKCTIHFSVFELLLLFFQRFGFFLLVEYLWVLEINFGLCDVFLSLSIGLMSSIEETTDRTWTWRRFRNRKVGSFRLWMGNLIVSLWEYRQFRNSIILKY